MAFVDGGPRVMDTQDVMLFNVEPVCGLSTWRTYPKSWRSGRLGSLRIALSDLFRPHWL